MKGVGAALLVVDCGLSIYNNFSNDSLSLDRKITDTIVDVGISIGGFAAVSGISSGIGTAVCPVVGTIVGFGFGVLIWGITEFTPIDDWIKDGVSWLVHSVEGWF